MVVHQYDFIREVIVRVTYWDSIAETTCYCIKIDQNFFLKGHSQEVTVNTKMILFIYVSDYV